MSSYNIYTLTPVHVGNGSEYLADFGFINIGEQVVILDEQKVLNHIGGETNMHQWLTTLENKTGMYKFLTLGGKSVTAQGIGKRSLICDGNLPPTATKEHSFIREQVRDANDTPYLPGSSIKGAFRTAILEKYTSSDHNRNIYFDKIVKGKDNKGFIRFSDKPMQTRHLGKDPNHDIFRLLIVGDAYFENTVCAETNSIILRGDDWQFESQFQQHIECIPTGEQSTMRLQFNKTLEKIANQKRIKGRRRDDAPYKLFQGKATNDLNEEQLFTHINTHTHKQVVRELEFWERETGYGGYVEPQIEDYRDRLRDIREQLETLQNEGNTACILRMGWGIGFRSMTGYWHDEKYWNEKEERFEDIYLDIIESARKKRGADYTPMPKTRRMLHDGTPLGFIRISK